MRPADRRTFDDICRDLCAGLREALAPFAHQTDAEIMARPDLTPPEARLVVDTRRTVAEYDRADIIGEVVLVDGEPRAIPVRRTP
jgi:hypothetical protein